MSNEIAGKRVAFLVANEGVEQVELTEPWKAVQDGGGTPTLVSVNPGQVQAFNHLDKGDSFPVDETVDAAQTDNYDALVLPGGVANPDFLRDAAQSRRVREIIRGCRETRRRYLPRPMDADRGRCRQRSHHHLMAKLADRPKERRSELGRRRGCGLHVGTRSAHLQPQAR